MKQRRNKSRAGALTNLNEVRRRTAAAVGILLTGTEDDEQQEAQPEEARPRSDNGVLVDR